MEPPSSEHILVVAHQTAATPALIDAITQRAERGRARFHLLVPNPASAKWHPLHPRGHEQVAEAERILRRALPFFEYATGGCLDGSVSIRRDPMDAIEEALNAADFDEIIIWTLPRGVARRLHLDLPRRVAHLGLPVTTVVAGECRGRGCSSPDDDRRAATFGWRSCRKRLRLLLGGVARSRSLSRAAEEAADERP